MEIQGYFTKKGLALSAKLSAGSTLVITRVEAGAGQTADPTAATSLPQPKQTLELKPATRHDNTATIPAVLVAGDAQTDYALTELGVYAQDPEEGEILYKLYRLDDPVNITAGSRMVLRFYLEETVSRAVNVQPVVSVAGHTFDVDFTPVRDMVVTNKLETEPIHLTAEELVPYLKNLPRLVTSLKRIYVAGGTVTQTLDLKGFYGPGRIWVSPEGGQELTLTGGISAYWCSIQLVFSGLKLSGQITGSSYMEFYGCPIVGVSNCSIDGAGTSGKNGISGANSCFINISGCTIQNTASAVYANGSSLAAAESCTGSGNTRGSHVYSGGIILLCGTTADLLGGTSNLKNGGIIAKSSGALL